MRTTIRLDEHLLRKAKKHAAERGTTLTAVVEDSLRQTLAPRPSSRRRRRVRIPTFGKGGLLPGVNLDDTSALLDLMDGIDGSR